MNRYLYLNLIPESLVASMLPPEEYGKYLAVGLHRKSNEQAIFIEVEPGFEAKGIPLNQIEERCQPHPDGSPRKSTYLAIYRVLERLPISAMKAVYLVTDDARVLKIEPGPVPTLPGGLNLYQELTPMQPLVSSSLSPQDFAAFITDESQPVSVPSVAFCDLRLGELRENPQFGMSDNLPYHDIPHLRDCLMAVWKKGAKDVKVVNRRTRFSLPYRMIRSGVYVGSGSELIHFPFPKEEDLETRYYEWWRSAQF